MLQRYDVKSRRDVVDGRVSAQDAVNEFMTMWGKAGDSIYHLGRILRILRRYRCIHCR